MMVVLQNFGRLLFCIAGSILSVHIVTRNCGCICIFVRSFTTYWSKYDVYGMVYYPNSDPHHYSRNCVFVCRCTTLLLICDALCKCPTSSIGFRHFD